MSPSTPFPAFPSIDSFNAVGDIQPSLIRLCRSIDSFEPISTVFGAAGVGKTLTAKLLQQQYHDTHRVITIFDGSLQRSVDLLQYLVHDFECQTEGRDETTLRLELRDCLEQMSDEKRQILLIIDNAQHLTSEAFESIRSVTDLMIGDHPCVQAVLIGTQKLEELLIGSCSEAITQRIATRCYLHPLTENETTSYVHSTVSRFGAEPSEIIPDSAMTALFHCTNGIPRLINQLMTEAIDVAAELGESTVTRNIIESAWASLQQLPDPHQAKPEIEVGGDIEFGELSDFETESGMHAEQIKESNQRDQQPISSENPLDTTQPSLEPVSFDFEGISDSADNDHQPRGDQETLISQNQRLPELDYPVVIQSDEVEEATHSFEAPSNIDCLESIIEEKLGVADLNPQSSLASPDSIGQVSDEAIDEYSDDHPNPSEVESIFEEESSEVFSELSDDEFDAEAERHALIHLLGESYASEVLEFRSETPVGPVLDVNVVPRNESALERQKPSRVVLEAPHHHAGSEHDTGSVHPGQPSIETENQANCVSGEYHQLDQPHSNPPESKISAEDVNAMLRRLRAARGA